MLSENKGTYNYKNYIALGSFDGLHEGHLSLVRKTVSLAKENNSKSIVYTFKNHPRTFLNPSKPIKLLLDNNSKVEILKKENVDEVFFEDFNEDFMKLSPEDFIKYLLNRFEVRGIVVGFNYKFGYKNLGNVNLLQELCEKYSFELYIIGECKYLYNSISSTQIRESLSRGDIELANILLTRPYFIIGKVIHGKKLGRKLGFPTANIEYGENMILPKDGVYYTNIIWNNNSYKGITSVGNNPTVNGTHITVESYILNFQNEIYGDEIKVNFLKRIRDNIKFNSLDDLIAQINRDKKFAEKEK